MKTSISVRTDHCVPYCAIMTDDDETILQYAVSGLADGIASALVTLVEVRGGASRAIGAHMAVRADGGYCGYVSGGCSEAAVAAEAIEAIRKGMDRYLLIGEGSRFFDIVLPCGGGLTLAIHVLKDVAPIADAVAHIRSRRPTALRYDPSLQRITLEAQAAPIGWGDGSFVRAYRPKTRIVIFGRGIELETTANIASVSGFETFSYTGSSDTNINQEKIDRYTAVVLLYHDLDVEMPVLQFALNSDAFYIGALGSRKTHQRRCDLLSLVGFNDAAIGRIKAPIGIFGPVRDSQSLALSVLSEIVSMQRADDPSSTLG